MKRFVILMATMLACTHGFAAVSTSKLNSLNTALRAQKKTYELPAFHHVAMIYGGDDIGHQPVIALS
ncbi:MAG TPA: hypothetical protein VNC84_03635 [Gammaproteobacteria bacterium]|jgi:hypothetical protein|nr:hypothetical protein [Gammaproteobacteria bacterium]